MTTEKYCPTCGLRLREIKEAPGGPVQCNNGHTWEWSVTANYETFTRLRHTGEQPEEDDMGQVLFEGRWVSGPLRATYIVSENPLYSRTDVKCHYTAAIKSRRGKILWKAARPAVNRTSAAREAARALENFLGGTPLPPGAETPGGEKGTPPPGSTGHP